MHRTTFLDQNVIHLERCSVGRCFYLQLNTAIIVCFSICEINIQRPHRVCAVCHSTGIWRNRDIIRAVFGNGVCATDGCAAIPGGKRNGILRLLHDRGSQCHRGDHEFVEVRCFVMNPFCCWRCLAAAEGNTPTVVIINANCIFALRQVQSNCLFTECVIGKRVQEEVTVGAVLQITVVDHPRCLRGKLPKVHRIQNP